MVWQVVLAAGAAGLGAFGSNKAGRDQAKAFEAQARADEAATRFNFESFHRQASAQLSKGRALRAGSGIEMGTGSSLMVDEATISEIIRQEERILEEGKARAASLRASGKAAKRAGNINAATSLLKGVANIASFE